MLEKTFPPENTPRSPIPAMIELLKSAPDQENIRVFMARHLATAVHNRDSEEIFYWAVIHYGVVGGDVDPDVRDVLMETLDQAGVRRI